MAIFGSFWVVFLAILSYFLVFCSYSVKYAFLVETCIQRKFRMVILAMVNTKKWKKGPLFTLFWSISTISVKIEIIPNLSKKKKKRKVIFFFVLSYRNCLKRGDLKSFFFFCGRPGVISRRNCLCENRDNSNGIQP